MERAYPPPDAAVSTAASIPLWDSPGDALPALDRRDLDQSGEYVAVIGAGISGLTAALCLLNEGRKVLVLDRQGIGAGETLRTTAHLANALDDRYHRLARWHGAEGARLAALSHAAAIEWIERFCAGQPGACGFRRLSGYLLSRDRDERALRRECEAACAAGLDARLREDGVPGLPGLGAAVEFPRQARVDIDRLLPVLADAVRELGGRLARAEVVDIRTGSMSGGLELDLAEGEPLQARQAVVATNVPFHESVAIHTKQAAYRTYVVAARCPPEALPDVLLWDDGDPYHYVRWVDARDGAGPWLLIGGEDHKTGRDEDPDAYLRLQLWARERFAGAMEFTHAWSGQILEPADGLAFIGRDAGGLEGVYVITGDSGNGITHGVLGGLLVADLVAGRRNPWATLYSPSRKPVRASATWLRENADVAAQYAQWLASRPDAEQASALRPGQAGIFRRGMHLLAVSRQDDGRLSSFSARCPHLGCVVHWNAMESTWDCPCHGSRFAPEDGRVLNGPAACGLEPAACGQAPPPPAERGRVRGRIHARTPSCPAGSTPNKRRIGSLKKVPSGSRRWRMSRKSSQCGYSARKAAGSSECFFAQCGRAR